MTDIINTPLIQVSVETHYLDEHSAPSQQRFAFAYTIRIENCSDTSAQLLSRHWIITNAKNSVQEIKGDGVIGEQPHILPGEVYTYSSGAVLETNAGTMEGSYTMQMPDGGNFDVRIPAFSLATPRALH